MLFHRLGPALGRLAPGMAFAIASACSIDDGIRIDRDAYPLEDGGLLPRDGGDVPDAAPDAAPLPQGGVSVHYLSTDPEGELAAGTSHSFTLELYNELTGDVEDEEAFDIAAELSCESWSLDDADEQVVVERAGMVTFGVELTPSEADEACELIVSATARRNPQVGTTARLALQLGEAPAVGRTLALRHPRDDAGRLLLRESALPLEGEPIQFSLVNRTDAPADYEVELFVALPDGADTTGWPLEDDPRSRSICCVEPGIWHGDIRLYGPADALGQEGTLTLRLSDPEEELARAFVVIESP